MYLALIATRLGTRIQGQLKEPCADLLRIFLRGRNGAIAVGGNEDFHRHRNLQNHRHAKVCNEGVVVPITNGDVYVTGKNRTAVSILVFAFTFLPIPCGTKAQLPSGYEIQANVAANTIVKVD